MTTATLNPGTMTGTPMPGAAGNSTALATTGAQTPAASNEEAGTALVPWGVSSISDTVKNVITQPAVRRMLPLIVMLFVLVVFGLTYALMQNTPYRPVMPGLLEADQQAAFEALKKAEYNPKIDQQTGQLTVPSNRFHEARIYLASQGLPKAGATGLDSLKDQSSMNWLVVMDDWSFKLSRPVAPALGRPCEAR